MEREFSKYGENKGCNLGNSRQDGGYEAQRNGGKRNMRITESRKGQGGVNQGKI